MCGVTDKLWQLHGVRTLLFVSSRTSCVPGGYMDRFKEGSIVFVFINS
jgi:hypothetical protein